MSDSNELKEGKTSGMKPERYHLYEEIDWACVYKRLEFVALHSAAQLPDIFDGVSAEDVVTQVLSAFFEDPDGLGWNPTRGPLDRFLLGVLKHKTIDHLRRQRRTAGSLDDSNFAKSIYLVQSAIEAEPMDNVSSEIREAATGDCELEELLRAIPDIDDGHNVNQQLARELKTTTQNIVNRKKRLIRRLGRQSVINCHEEK